MVIFGVNSINTIINIHFEINSSVQQIEEFYMNLYYLHYYFTNLLPQEDLAGILRYYHQFNFKVILFFESDTDDC